MPVPISQMATVGSYLIRKRLAGVDRYPLVLMLEPLYQCNLACAGCGKIQYPKHILQRRLSVAECMAAVDSCSAPMVSIPGGEPLLHPEIREIVQGLVDRKKYIYLCTNALVLEEKLDLFEPSKYLSFSVHLDGQEKEHDAAVCREGTHAKAVSAIRKALERGFRVTTNTTLFDGADPERTAEFFDQAMELGVEGMMVSPGYAYEQAPDQEHFLARERTVQLFRRIFAAGKGGKQWHFNQSPLFLEFLTGERDYECTPWGMPAYSVFGWQKPCYLLQEGYARSYDDLLETTDWSKYGHASGNPSCRDCMVHSGFEASSVAEGFSSWRGFVTLVRASLFGARLSAPGPMPERPASVSAGEDATPTQSWSSPAGPEALRTAFDYRGDVTLTLDDGEKLEGYVSSSEADALRLLVKGRDEAELIDPARVTHVELSGRDTSIDPRWEAWKQKQI